jgi:hypothetical protein
MVSQSMGTSLRKVHVTPVDGTAIIPSSAVFVRCDNYINPKDLVTTSREKDIFFKEANYNNFHSISVQNRFYRLDDENNFLPINDFAVKVAEELSITVPEVGELITKMSSDGSTSIDFVLEKKSEDAPAKKEPSKKSPSDKSQTGSSGASSQGQAQAASHEQGQFSQIQEQGGIDPTTGMPMGSGEEAAMMGQMGGAGAPMSPEQELAPYVAQRASNFNLSPELIDRVLGIGIKGLFEVSTIASLGSNSALGEIAEKYLPHLTTGMDTLARSLMLVRYQNPDINKTYGEDEANKIETQFSHVLAKLGDLIIMINKNNTPPINSAMTLGSN